MGPVVQLQQVSVQLGAVRALQQVNLSIVPGERVALIGPNGSGKSTLLRTLHGLLAPSSGQVWRDPARRQAMLFQRPHLLRLSALANVALGLWLDRSLGLSWAQARTRAHSALERVGLLAVAAQGGRQLSGGQQQRLALARAWALQPDILFLDEPTASLDPSARREVEALIAEFAQAGLTLVMSTHNLGQVKRLATRVLYLEGGRLVADRPTGRFFEAPADDPLPPEAVQFLKGELPWTP